MAFAIREAYCPAYFGNTNEAMWPREKARYLAEMQSWGYNWYGDVQPSFDIRNPYTSQGFSNLALELTRGKRAAFHAAASLGMELDVHLWPNHAFLDQLRPELDVVRTPRIPGQLVIGHPLCPSKPEARALMLDDCARLFRDLAEHEIPVAAFSAWAYDFGGCMCDECAPYILTFAKLLDEMRAIARGFFPSIRTRVVTWWWSDEEHRLFDQWLAQQAPGWLDGMVLQIGYGATRPHVSAVPDGSERLGFLHIGYGDTNPGGEEYFGSTSSDGNRDVYGKFGAVVAARRIPETLANLAATGAAGFQAFSEGMFDDINKALAGALGSGLATSPDAVLREYAERYFGARGETSARWARWLAAWGDRGTVELPAARDEFEALAASATPGWRLEHLGCKLALEELDRALVAGGEAWDAERLALAAQFDEEWERMKRQVYGMGPVRVMHSVRYRPPVWYAGWQEALQDERRV